MLVIARLHSFFFFFFQAEDGIRDGRVTGVQTCALPILLDHCGGPIGLGSYAGRRDEIFSGWKKSIQEIAACPNVHVKLGGLAMRLLGYDFHERAMPPSSEDLAAAWRPIIETCIEAFGPARAMFESNFPPDKGQCSYQVIFNTFKRLAAQYSEAEKTALFSETAAAVYGLVNRRCDDP